jgi:hypothetical protein
LTQTLHAEIAPLGYPKAALFSFGVALVSSNVASAVRAALRAKFGHDKVEEEVSGYYIANEVRNTYAGMEIVLDESIWEQFQTMPPKALAEKLVEYAGHARLAAFKRQPRGPKKPVPPRTRYVNETHVSTARLLARSRSKMSP